MLAVEVTVLVDRFRLDPDAEFHALGGEFVPQSFESVRELLGICVPVTERMFVVIALSEPPVVHHEHF